MENEPASFFLLVSIRKLKLPTNFENEIVNMKHREPEYNIYSENDGWKDLVSRGEWASWVRAGKRGSINQIVGWFGTSGNLSWIMVSTGPSNRWQCAAGEWESLVLDHFEIDLVNPSYCRGSVKEIEAMHGRAVSNARKWLRNYVERPIHYSENMRPGALRRAFWSCAPSEGGLLGCERWQKRRVANGVSAKTRSPKALRMRASWKK